jgi:hypothetical protein
MKTMIFRAAESIRPGRIAMPTCWDRLSSLPGSAPVETVKASHVDELGGAPVLWGDGKKAGIYLEDFRTSTARHERYFSPLGFSRHTWKRSSSQLPLPELYAVRRCIPHRIVECLF